jgi:hypothetical protein
MIATRRRRCERANASRWRWFKSATWICVTLQFFADAGLASAVDDKNARLLRIIYLFDIR